GGLGVHDVKSLNLGLLGKCVWRYATERSAWWRRLIVAKCGVGPSSWQPVWGMRSVGRSVWKWIVLYSSIFWSHGFIDPGGGLCNFWSDYWIQGVRLSSLYPRIAAASQSLGSSVSDLCSFGETRIWSIPLRFDLRGGALEEWLRFLSHLNSIPTEHITAGPASIVWPLEASGVFSVKSLRGALSDQVFRGIGDFPSDVIWVHFVPSKIQCFIWMVYNKKIATIDNLQRRGFHLAGRCALCFNHSESVNHIFLEYEYTRQIWSRLNSALSIYGPFHNDVVGFFSAWKCMNCLPCFQIVMKCIVHALCWSVWLERNHRMFRDDFHSPLQTFSKIIWMVGNWLVSWSLMSRDMVSSWFRAVFDNG
ncbi:Putative ribonuclease H protein At1g65750, partial [Linum grandiflorum]